MYNKIKNAGHFTDTVGKHLPLQYQFIAGDANPIPWQDCNVLTFEATANWPANHDTVLYKPSSSDEVSNQRQDNGDGTFDMDDF
jgi:hypothetical protein